MVGLDKQRFIQRTARRNRGDVHGSSVLWSRHALAALLDDDLDRRQVEFALENGVVIEDYYAANRPLPDCLVLCLHHNTPIHAVVAIDEANDRIFMVTVYIPSAERWLDDWRTRK